MLRDGRTGKDVRPATRSEWERSHDDPFRYVAVLGGIDTYVDGGPKRLDCGHTEADHVKRLEDARDCVLGAITWLRANGDSGSQLDLPEEYHVIYDDYQACAILCAVTARLADLAGWGRDLVVSHLWHRQAPVAAVAVGHVLGAMEVEGPLHPRWLRLVDATDCGDRNRIMELAANAADAAEMSPDDIRDMIGSLSFGDSDG
jgi:hypothetical protein